MDGKLNVNDVANNVAVIAVILKCSARNVCRLHLDGVVGSWSTDVALLCFRRLWLKK